MEYMLGIDIGTTSTKAVLFNRQGKVQAQHAVDYPMLSSLPGMAEQDPRAIYLAVLDSIRLAVAASGLRPEQIGLAAFSAAMHSLILIDEHDELLSNSYTWADNRAGAQAASLRGSTQGQAIYARTGTPIHPMSPLCKLLWLREEQPALFARAARFVGIKEYVLFRLFGQWKTDYSIASATGLFNLRLQQWDGEALALAGIAASALPQPVPTTHVLQGLRLELAEQLGLMPGLPFVIGANDGVLSNLGVGAMHAGDVAVTIGTSGAMRSAVRQPLMDAAGRSFCYSLADDYWVIGGPVNNGGNVLQWLREHLAADEAEHARNAGQDASEAIMRIAAGVRPGAEGLLFHPYLAGERAPLWNADLRGSFFGLASHHSRDHMLRAALEGVIFNLYSILPVVEELAGPARRLLATGGFARSPLWRQMMADIFEREVVVPQSVESSCLGAVQLGMLALGEITSLEEAGNMVGLTSRHEPVSANAALYRELKPIFLALPHKLQQEYYLLAQFQSRHAMAAG
jgi:gluconokinase